MITIHNLHNEQPKYPYDFKVDRSSPLGNPFFMTDESKRDEVCDKYRFWFLNQANRGYAISAFWDYLKVLKEAHNKYGKLRLFCFCAPRRCHSETIKQYLEEEEL